MIYIFIILSLSFSLDFSRILINEKNNYIVSTSNNTEKKLKSPVTYGFYSAIVPGYGQYELYKLHHNKIAAKRTALFLGIEAISWISTLAFNNKYKSQVSKYKEFANSEIGWDFAHWISEYETFNEPEYSYLFQNNVWQNIGAGSHSIQFYMGENIVSTTDDDFYGIYEVLLNTINSNENIYDEHLIRIIKDQHYYENIGKYNEFFAGWSDADILNIYMDTTEQNYMTALSPKKDQYIESYNQAEEYSDFKEYSTLCIYFNHFVSMVDAFILARKFNGNVMLASSTVYDQYSINLPIGIKLSLIFKI